MPYHMIPVMRNKTKPTAADKTIEITTIYKTPDGNSHETMEAAEKWLADYSVAEQLEAVLKSATAENDETGGYDLPSTEELAYVLDKIRAVVNGTGHVEKNAKKRRR